MKTCFDHEKLNAYQGALRFAVWLESVLEKTPRGSAVYGQLDRAHTSIVLNIAEGNAKFTPPDRCKFFDIARGSAVECAACLDLLLLKKVVTVPEVETDKQELSGIVTMLVGLMKRSLPDRFGEEEVGYRVEGDGAD